MTDQQFCLRWNNHQSTLVAVFDGLLEKGVLVDCTLAAEGQQLTAHKVVLAACSPFLETLLSRHYDKHPILILKDVKFSELKAMMDYMYRGEVNISQDQLGTFLKAAESLQIKGLSDGGGGTEKNVDSHNTNKRHHDRKQHRPNSPLRNSLLNDAKRAPYNLQNSVRNSLKSSPLLVDIPEDSPLNRPRDGSMSPVPRKKKRSRDQDESINNTSKTENIPPHEAVNNHQENSSNSVDLPNSVPVPRVPSPSESKPPPAEPIADKTELKHELEEEEDINEDSVELTLEDEDLGEAGPSHNDGEFGEYYSASQDGDHRDGQASFMEEFKFNAAKYFNSTRPDDFRSKDAEIKKALSSNFKLLNDQEFSSLYNKLAEANMTIENRNGGFKFENLIRPEDLLKVNNNKKGNYKNGNVSRKNWRFTYHGQDMSLATNYAHVEFENSVDVDQEKLYSCSTCKKKYRWKSTLRRHEMVECGGKEPSFQCPQCPYKAKQRGNLGVHMRKYHSSV